MDQSTGDFIVSDFFTENKVETHNIQVIYQTEALLESIVKPIEIS
jgi:hypothetical protein